MGSRSSSPFSLFPVPGLESHVVCIVLALLCLHLQVAIETAHFCSELEVAAALGSAECETSHSVLTVCTAPLNRAIASASFCLPRPLQ